MILIVQRLTTNKLLFYTTYSIEHEWFLVLDAAAPLDDAGAEVIKHGVHVDVVVLKRHALTVLLHLLHQPAGETAEISLHNNDIILN